MKYELMMKNYPVLEFSVKKDSIHEIYNIKDEKRIPLNLMNRLSEENLQLWIEKRIIPKSRYNYKLLLKEFKKNIWSALEHTHALNLSDQYWIRAENECLDWNKINFFDNSFSYDMGNYLITGQVIHAEPDWKSPDFCTNGNTPKTWRIKNNERFLLKGNLDRRKQESINEVIVSKFIQLTKSPNLSCMESSLTKIHGELFSCSKNFLSNSIELVPASYICQYKPRPDNVYIYNHLIAMCNELNIPNVSSFLSEMLAIDFLICNKDRHLGNFGFLRNSDTLEFLGPAPLYDNGNSLWFDEDLENSGPNLFDNVCKPFAPFFSDQMKYIDCMDCLETLHPQYLISCIKHAMYAAEYDSKKANLIADKVEMRYEILSKELVRNLAKNKAVSKEYEKELEII